MKKIVYTILMLCMAHLLSTQATTAQAIDRSIIGKYYWNKNIAIAACNLDGTITKIDFNKLNTLTTGNQLFAVIDVKTIDGEDYAIIRILDYKLPKQLKNFYDYNFIGSAKEYDGYIKQYPNTSNYGIYQRYFKVKAAELLENATAYTYIGGALAGGIINFPFKLRLQQDANDFSSAFNLGGAFGYTLPHYSFRNFTYSILFAAALSNVNLDASNVKQNADMLATANDFSALTFAIGGLVTYDRFQAGIFLGIDRIGNLNNTTFNWRYQNKPWLSIGFGYAIFSIEKPAVTTSDNQP